MINRVRRMAYGLTLLLALPCAQAQDERADEGHHPRRFRLSPPVVRMQDGLPQLTDAAQALSLRLTSDNHGSMLRASETSGAIDGGLGIAVGVPDMGYLYVNLYSNDDPSPGDWRVDTSGGDLPARPLTPHEQRTLLRGVDPNAVRVAISPQLMIDVDRLTSTHTHLEASLQYAPWSSISDRPGCGNRMPQVALRWPF